MVTVILITMINSNNTSNEDDNGNISNDDKGRRPHAVNDPELMLAPERLVRHAKQTTVRGYTTCPYLRCGVIAACCCCDDVWEVPGTSTSPETTGLQLLPALQLRCASCYKLQVLPEERE